MVKKIEKLLPLKTAEISLNLPVWMLEEINAFASYCDVPREDVIKVWLADKIQQ